MPVQLDHMIVPAHDKDVCARFLADILGLPDPVAMGPFIAVEVNAGLSLDFADADGTIQPQHLAFRVGEPEFEEVLDRVRGRGLLYWADPRRSRLNEVGQRSSGRGFYFEDPSGHYLEVLTRPDA